MTDAPHIVNVSGGKDSAATYLLALERGRPFRAICADTGHEHPETVEFIQRLGERTGGPEVEMVRADFSDRMQTRRRNLRKKWGADGISDERIERALAVIHPTGNPFLDLCILKGRFPSVAARFCTQDLKEDPIIRQVVIPALRERGRVVQWIGVRRDESKARSNTPTFRRVRWARPVEGCVLNYYPIAKWTAEDVFALHRRHGLEPNPLYKRGLRRVGCWPCIMAQKDEIALIGAQTPEVIDRLEEWEDLVAQASKSGAGTFFASDKTPRGAAMAKRGEKGGAEEDSYPRAREVFDWSTTGRGGHQRDFIRLTEIEDALAICSSHYGLCE